MASLKEKSGPDTIVDSPAESHYERQARRPTGWIYKESRIFGVRIPCFASPQVQIVMVALVCFLCPGQFNALGGLGGGGQVDVWASTQSNTALYSTFAVVGFFAGTFTNWLGVKLSLSLGGMGYCIYVAAYLCYNHTQNFGFMVFAGALLGVCAGLLWSAQGAIMLSYPQEQYKGRYVAVFWAIFNLGGVIGALVPLGQNINVQGNDTVSDGTYVGFIVLTFVGGLLAWSLVDAKKIVRDDGSRVIVMKHPTAASEFLGVWQTLINDPWIILLWPMFFASNWFYTYQFNDVNLAQFNTRTRALNNVLYWSAQIVGAAIFGTFLDTKYLRRTTRAKAGWLALFVLTMVIWGGGYDFQKGYTREETTDMNYQKMDWTTPGYVGPMFLYLFYGVYDAAWQTTIYWFMGAMSNNSRVLANYAAFYKGIQSAGYAWRVSDKVDIIADTNSAAIIWRLDGLGADAPPFMNLFASCWALLAGSLIVALPVMIIKIKDTVPLEEDLKLSDETVEEVTGQVPLDAVAREKV